MRNTKTLFRLTVLGVVVACTLLIWIPFNRTHVAVDVGRAETVIAQASEAVPERTVSASRRPAIPPDLEQPSVVTIAAPRGFDAIYADIVHVFVAVQSEGSAGRAPNAAAANARASELFKEVAESECYAGELALSKLDALPAPWNSHRARAEALACHLLIDFDLQQMASGNVREEAMAPLVNAMIERLPFSEDYARTVHRLLNERPYLGGEQEPWLLDLASIADGELSYMADPVSSLLVTLWANIGQSRATSTEDLLRYFNDPSTGALGLAAQHELLLQPEYRDLVVQHLVQLDDGVAMTNMATFAAANLSAEDAIDVARAFKAAAQSMHFGGAYTKLAEQSRGTLRASYESSLADGVDPGHREQAVLALTYEPGSDGIAQHAFRNDPTPRVRGVALLALSRKNDDGLFRDMFEEALRDDSLMHPRHVGYLVLSLKNVAKRSGREGVAELASSLLASDTLSYQHRETLEALL